jgi:DNA-binding NarL/FixJ family response regulator
MRRLLEEIEGVAVVGEASNGHQALELAATSDPHVVLLDVAMPILNGLEAATRLSKSHPDIRVIILSMHADEEYVAQALRAGASGYLIKDSSVPELEIALRSVLRGERYLSSVISTRLALDYLRTRSAAAPILTSRQREILQLIAEGHSIKSIAHRLGVSAKTAESHRAQLMERLDIHDIPGLVRFAIRTGLVSADQ